MTNVQSAFEIAKRVALRGSLEYSWVVIISSYPASDIEIEAVCTELEALTSSNVRPVIEATFSVERLRKVLQSPSDDVVVVVIGNWTDRDWTVFDINRSAFERRGAILLWIKLDQLGWLTENAPNIRSFIGTSFFHLGPDVSEMTAKEKKDRLTEFEAHYAMSSDQMLEQALTGKIIPDPQAVEWLILLGRGDLIS